MTFFSRFFGDEVQSVAATESFTGDDPPPPPPLCDRRDFIVAAVLFAAFTALYLFSSSLWAFPGASADLACMVTGAVPLPTPVNQAYIAFMRIFVPFGGAKAATVATIAIAAATVGIMYLFAMSAFRALMDVQYIRDSVANGAFHAGFVPRMAGLVAAVALATCPPFWMAATRLTPYVFCLFFLLLCAWLSVRFAAESLMWHGVAAAAVLGALCTQSTTAIQFLPAFLIVWIFAIIISDKPKLLVAGLQIVAFVAAMGLSAWACVRSFDGGEGYKLMEYEGPVQVVVRFIQPIFLGSIASFTKPHWLIFGGMTVLPFFAWVFVGRFSLSGPDASPAVHSMNAAILASALMVLFGSRYSPWGLLGFQAEQVFVHALAASSLAYCFAAAWLQILFRYSLLHTGADAEAGQDGEGPGSLAEAPALTGSKPVSKSEDDDAPSAIVQRENPMASLALRVLVLVATGWVLFRIGSFGRAESDDSMASFIRTYVDGVIDGLDGRDIIVTDKLFAAMYRLRARERGIDVDILDLSEGAGTPTRKLFRSSLHDPALLNALDLGSFPFLQETIGRVPSVARRFALTWFPDLWNLGPYRMFPKSLLFLGASDTAPRDNPLQENSSDALGADVANYLAFLDRIGPELAVADASKNRGTTYLAETVRRRLSFFGNDLAWYIDGAGRKDEALSLWRVVHDFDPGNISAMLNLFNALERSSPDSEECAAVRKELDDFAAQLKRPLQIWELSRSQGYVSDPRAFARLGWSWAMTGQTALAIGTLSSAIRDSEDAKRLPFIRMIAAIHAKDGDYGKSEERWLEAVAANPNDVQSIFGLISARMRDGRTEGLNDFFERLAQLGVPQERIFPYRLQSLLVAGDTDTAVTIAEMRLRENSSDPDLVFALFTALLHAQSNAPEDSRRDIRTRLEDLASRLRENAGARTRQGAIATASLHLLDRNWRAARDEFVLAERSAPGDISLMEQLLRLDYALYDTSSAGQHARELVRVSPDHGFANYVLGSLALQSGNTSSAVAFLTRSVSVWDSPLPRGDLAYAKYLQGDASGALVLAEETLAIRDSLYNAWDTKGLALLALDRSQEAVEAFQKAISINASEPVIHLHLARALFATGEVKAATEILDSADRLGTSFKNEDLSFFTELRADIRGAR